MNLKKIVVGKEDILFAIRVLTGSSREGESREKIMLQFEQELPKLLGQIAIQINGGAQLAAPRKTKAFYAEFNRALDALFFPFLPLYHGVKSWQCLIDEDTAIQNFRNALQSPNPEETLKEERLKAHLSNRLSTLYGSFSSVIQEFIARVCSEMHPFTRFVTFLFILAILDALRVKVESVP